jgi:hypothetical protein
MSGEMSVVREGLLLSLNELDQAKQAFGAAIESYDSYQGYVTAAVGTLATSREHIGQLAGIVRDTTAEDQSPRAVSARILPGFQEVQTAFRLTLRAQRDQAITTLGGSQQTANQAASKHVLPACSRIRTVLEGETAGLSGETLEYANALAAHMTKLTVHQLWEIPLDSLKTPTVESKKSVKLARLRQVDEILANEEKRLGDWGEANGEYGKQLTTGVELIEHCATNAYDYAARL